MSRVHNPSSTDPSSGSARLLDARVCAEVGGRLAAAREQRKLTHADVGNRLLLSIAQVHGLERADASAFHNPAFFAVAIRKYATLMAVDCPEAILTPKSPATVRPLSAQASGPASARTSGAASERRSTGAPGNAALPTSAARPSRFSIPMEWLAVATVVAIILAITGAGLAFYFHERKPRPVQAGVGAGVGAGIDRTDGTDRADGTDATTPPVTAVTTADIDVSSRDALSEASPPDEPVDRADPSPIESVAAPVATSALATTPAGSNAGVVTLARPAWVFVRYGNNSVMQRTLQAGQSLTLTSPPIYMAIGTGEGVTLTIRERAVDVSPFRNGNEIRIGASDLAALTR